ncbi:MAG: preprotein translocase subunit SecE [Acidimicrobiia bacterium]|nr:preprotein translocase subunit SecE [Acidimicrobiia bacterium]
MNREMRRLQEREERRRKKEEAKAGGRVAKAQRAASQSKASKLPWYKRIPAFLGDVRQELKRVSWPTRDQMIVFTTVTLITTTTLTLVVFGLDVVMKEAVFWVVGRT